MSCCANAQQVKKRSSFPTSLHTILAYTSQPNKLIQKTKGGRKLRGMFLLDVSGRFLPAHFSGTHLSACAVTCRASSATLCVLLAFHTLCPCREGSDHSSRVYQNHACGRNLQQFLKSSLNFLWVANSQ